MTTPTGSPKVTTTNHHGADGATTTGDTMTTLTPATTPDAPTTPDTYARRLVAAGFTLHDARRIARDADARGAFTPTTAPAYDDADTAAGAGWSVVALHADGRGEILTTTPTHGAAATLAAGYDRAATIGAATGARRRSRIVVVPAYDADAVAGAR